MDQPHHQTFMRRALALARRAEGRTSPNPMVGAVLVKEGRVVGEGWHHHAGGPHAEAEALQEAGEAARGATLYVTLEPCAHHGRTPPCAEALLAAGVAEVFYATSDPNPGTHGRGPARLEAAGVNVQRGPCEEEAKELIRPFTKHITTGRPLVTAKFAMSLDGKIATRGGDSRWISQEASRLRVHQLRNVTDALLVGAGTVLADDPQLTTRIEGEDVRHPLRIVADSRGRVPLSARVFDPALPGKTVLATTEAPPEHRDRLSSQGVEVWALPSDPLGRVDLGALLDRVGRQGLLTLLAEGGSELLGSLFAARLVDRVWAFVAPRIIGGREAPGPVGGPGAHPLAQATWLDSWAVETLASSHTPSQNDLWVRAEVRYPEEG